MWSPACRVALYVSLAICAAGVAWRLVEWLRVRIGPDASGVSFGARVAALVRGAGSAVFSARVLSLLRALLLDSLLQWRLLRRAPFRWLAHMAILVGFTFLLVVHAMARVVTEKLVKGYAATLDPWLTLRNVAGAMVIAGMAVILVARWRSRAGLPRAARPGDRVFVVLLGVVLVTGFLLESVKIASPRAFDRMAEEYMGTTDPEELAGLRALWASEYGVAFTDVALPADAETLGAGREMHNDACAECHSPPSSAFVSWPVARAIAPIAGALDERRADAGLYLVHVFACFFGLAAMPFTRLFHVVADPASLLANGAARPGAQAPVAARATRRALGVSACVRCGLCDARCSVAPVARSLGNEALLPSHKLVATERMAGGRAPGWKGMPAARLAEGAFACTSCGRCTERCPAGIDLDDLWAAGRETLAAAGYPAPAQWVQARPAVEWAEDLASRQEAAPAAGTLTSDRRTFSPCVQCQTCTNVCPVVAHGSDGAVDLTPQKVMNLLRLGLVDLAIGSRMVWCCATCYQCQEICPEGIRVTDVMYELRGLAYRRLGAVRDRRRKP